MNGRLEVGAFCHGETELERGDQREAAQRRFSPNHRPPLHSPATAPPRLSTTFHPSNAALARLLSISREMTSGGHRHIKH